MDFGRRPRRAAARPGILPAQLSQRSACFAPRRASVYVTRITAPFPSSTSFPQLSHTSTVFRATVLLLRKGDFRAKAYRNHVATMRAPVSAEFPQMKLSHSCAHLSFRTLATIAAMRDERTIVVLDGDETGQELLEESLRVLEPDVIGVELEFPRFDLSLERRRETDNGVVHEAATAIREHGLGLKAATVTPEGRGDIGSPNRILREEIGGKVIVRTGRRIPGVAPLGGVHAPISIVRMAVGDAYGAKEWREGEGDAEVAFRTERIERRICHAVAEFAFRQAERTGAKVFGGPKYTVSPTYEGMLKEEMDAAAARHPEVPYEP